jgi:hypothetical protein
LRLRVWELGFAQRAGKRRGWETGNTWWALFANEEISEGLGTWRRAAAVPHPVAALGERGRERARTAAGTGRRGGGSRLGLLRSIYMGLVVVGPLTGLRPSPSKLRCSGLDCPHRDPLNLSAGPYSERTGCSGYAIRYATHADELAVRYSQQTRGHPLPAHGPRRAS